LRRLESRRENRVSADHDEKPHVPPPSLWPIGFAIGIACILVGLVLSWPAVAVGAVIAAVFAVLWIRDATRDVRAQPVEVEPETRVVADAPAAEPAEAEEEVIETYPRSVFLEASTLGIGALIGGLVTLPVLGFAVLPSFTNQKKFTVDLGPLENFPEGKFVIATFGLDPSGAMVTHRTAYIRNNGSLNGTPSFTTIFNRCVHLGCPVQPNGPTIGTPKKYKNVSITPVLPASFGCPCHGGQYDTEGNRTAGPPVRSLDRFEFSIVDGHLILGELYSISKVVGTGANAKIKKYPHEPPGVHVDGAEAWFYPIEVPQ